METLKSRIKKIRTTSTIIATVLILTIFCVHLCQYCSYKSEVRTKIREENEKIKVVNEKIRSKNSENNTKKGEALEDSLKMRNGKLCGSIRYFIPNQVKMVKDYDCERSCKKEFYGSDREKCTATCFKRTEVNIRKDVDTCIHASSMSEAYRIIHEIRKRNFHDGKYVYDSRPLIDMPQVPDSVFPISEELEYKYNIGYDFDWWLPEISGQNYREIQNKFLFLEHDKYYGLKLVCTILFIHICLLLFLFYKESLYVVRPTLSVYNNECAIEKVLEKYRGIVLIVPYISAFVYCVTLSAVMIAISFVSIFVIPTLYLAAMNIIKKVIADVIAKRA